MTLVTGLVTLVGILFAYVLYLNNKKNNAEALNSNLETKEKVQDVQKDIDKNEAKIEAEEQKRKEIQDKADEEKNKDVSKDELLDFFNKDKK